jgi:hypothetical protein
MICGVVVRTLAGALPTKGMFIYKCIQVLPVPLFSLPDLLGTPKCKTTWKETLVVKMSNINRVFAMIRAVVLGTRVLRNLFYTEFLIRFFFQRCHQLIRRNRAGYGCSNHRLHNHVLLRCLFYVRRVCNGDGYTHSFDPSGDVRVSFLFFLLEFADL